jgi:hypothetical protein
MSSLNQSSDDSLSVSENTTKYVTNFGVAGSEPLADYADRLNVLLCNAVKARWDTYVISPTASKILFGVNWFAGIRDIEIVFRQGFEDRPIGLRGSRSTDGRLQQHVSTIDCHIGVRSNGGSNEPANLNKSVNGLEKVIAMNETVLIPNAYVFFSSTQQGPTEKVNDLQTFYHVLCKVRVMYYKVRTI